MVEFRLIIWIQGYDASQYTTRKPWIIITSSQFTLNNFCRLHLSKSLSVVVLFIRLTSHWYVDYLNTSIFLPNPNRLKSRNRKVMLKRSCKISRRHILGYTLICILMKAVNWTLQTVLSQLRNWKPQMKKREDKNTINE